MNHHDPNNGGPDFDSPRVVPSLVTRTTDLNILALVKGGERYVFAFTDENREETRRLFGRFASNPELSFTWYDAAVLSQRLRSQAIECSEMGGEA